MDKAESNFKTFLQSCNIIADTGIDPDIATFFHLQQIKFDFLPDKQKNIGSLLDYICSKYGLKQKLILLVTVPRLIALLDTKSNIKKVKALVDSKRLKIIINDIRAEVCAEEDLRRHCFGVKKPHLPTLIKEFDIDFLSESVVDNKFQNYYPRVNWITYAHPAMLLGFHSMFADLIDPQADRQKTFFSLIHVKKSRPHRKTLLDELQSHGPLPDAVVRDTGNIQNTHLIPGMFTDIEQLYAKPFLDGITWKDPVPRYDLYNQTNFELVCETLGNDDNVFWPTEKITKPITMRHPFIVFGGQHFLKHLKTLGFQTFHEHINESYDNIADPRERTKAIADLVKSFDLPKAQKFFADTRQICDHNFNHMCLLHGRQTYDKSVVLKNYFIEMHNEQR